MICHANEVLLVVRLPDGRLIATAELTRCDRVANSAADPQVRHAMHAAVVEQIRRQSTSAP